MRITIGNRYKPYIHQAGQACLIPGTTWQATVYPQKVNFIDVSDSKGFVKPLILDIKGPLKDFTVQVDLEKACLRVWGKGPEGFLRYRIFAGFLILEKLPKDQLEFYWEGKIFFLRAKEFLSLFLTQPLTLGKKERLSLGSHRAQDWELVKRRMDLHHFIPICLRFNEFLPELEGKGSLSLLDELRAFIEGHQVEALQGGIENLMRGAFEGLCCPRLEDKEWQGLEMKASSDLTTLSVLKLSAELLRRLFLIVERNNFFILPHLSKLFHCGRFLELSCGSLGILDIEWSKKCIRRLCFRPNVDGPVNFVFCGGVKSCRLRTNRKSPGMIINCSKPLRCVVGKEYFLDNFKK